MGDTDGRKEALTTCETMYILNRVVEELNIVDGENGRPGGSAGLPVCCPKLQPGNGSMLRWLGRRRPGESRATPKSPVRHGRGGGTQLRT